MLWKILIFSRRKVDPNCKSLLFCLSGKYWACRRQLFYRKDKFADNKLALEISAKCAQFRLRLKLTQILNRAKLWAKLASNDPDTLGKSENFI